MILVGCCNKKNCVFPLLSEYGAINCVSSKRIPLFFCLLKEFATENLLQFSTGKSLGKGRNHTRY